LSGEKMLGEPREEGKRDRELEFGLFFVGLDIDVFFLLLRTWHVKIK